MRGDHYLTVLNSRWYRGLVDVQDALSQSMAFFADRGLKVLHLPITTQSISSPMGLGSDSGPVAIELFGVRTYLADSMQFMLEYGCRLSPRGCYYMMPSFRAESPDETHLSQFYHVEAEIPGSLDDALELAEGYIRATCLTVLENCRHAVEELAGSTVHIEEFLSRGRLPRISVDEAFQLIGCDPAFQRTNGLPPFRSLTRRGEVELLRQMGGFVWVTDPDHLSVPFYQAFADSSKRKALAADLLFGVGEVVGAGERHKCAAAVAEALAMHNVDPDPYIWYQRIRECSPMMTSGFGLGTERFICWILKHNDVRDCQLVPRANGEVLIP
jgi:asparaginyl-tRNA synthetase